MSDDIRRALKKQAELDIEKAGNWSSVPTYKFGVDWEINCHKITIADRLSCSDAVYNKKRAPLMKCSSETSEDRNLY